MIFFKKKKAIDNKDAQRRIGGKNVMSYKVVFPVER